MTAETPATNATKNVIKERFEFILTINNNIVCQRYFKIPILNDRSLYSKELFETFNYCVGLIQRELNSKTNVYNWYAAPQIFSDMVEFAEWTEKHPTTMPVPTYVVIKSEGSVYIWDGEKISPYGRKFTLTDFIGERKDENECTLKFTVIDNGTEEFAPRLLYSRAWDATMYPRFVRNNIDLSNQKNKYANDEEHFYDFLLMNMINFNRGDLVFKIISEICNTCADRVNSHYTTCEKYGKTTYHNNIENQPIEKFFKKYSKK